MPTFRFEFQGERELLIPDGYVAAGCAHQIVTGKCYPFPGDSEGVLCVVDLGAHAGEFTVMAALVWPEADIHAYEPNPEVLPLLTVNAKQCPNILIHPAAVDVLRGTQTLYRHDLGSVAYHLGHRREDSREGMQVQVESIADVMLLKPDVLKIDIEGLELDVLRSVADLLPAVGRIYVEFHGEEKRIAIDQLLVHTHYLGYCNLDDCSRGGQGELMYVKRVTISKDSN